MSLTFRLLEVGAAAARSSGSSSNSDIRERRHDAYARFYWEQAGGWCHERSDPRMVPCHELANKRAAVPTKNGHYANGSAAVYASDSHLRTAAA